MAPRERLLILVQRAGYSPGALERIAQALLPAYVPGNQLADEQILAVCGAVETCAQTGMTDEQIPAIVDDYRRLFGDAWRDRFWQRRMSIANTRSRQPGVYGTSPCDEPEPLGPYIPDPTFEQLAAEPPAAAFVDVEPQPTVAPEPAPVTALSLPDGFEAPAPAPAAVPAPAQAPAYGPLTAVPVTHAPEIHPAVAAAPVLRDLAAAV